MSKKIDLHCHHKPNQKDEKGKRGQATFGIKKVACPLFFPMRFVAILYHSLFIRNSDSVARSIVSVSYPSPVFKDHLDQPVELIIEIDPASRINSKI